MEKERLNYKGHTIVIEYDDSDVVNPRQDWDNLGTIAYKHSRYNLGEEEIGDPIDWLMEKVNVGNWDEDEIEYTDGTLRDLEVDVFFNKESNHVGLKLYLYDHSGLSISCRSFVGRSHHGGWDSCPVGYIYSSLENAIENWQLPKDSTWETTIEEWYGPDKGKPISLRDATIRVLEGEVETFDNYLRGEVYGFRVLDEEGEDIDSCWGYIGDDNIPDMIEECKGIVDLEIKDGMKNHFNKMKAWIKNHAPLYARKSNPLLFTT